MKKDELTALCYDPKTGNSNAPGFSFKTSEVLRLTMAPDGTTFANLKNFRQARIRLIDYMNLKGCNPSWNPVSNPK